MRSATATPPAQRRRHGRDARPLLDDIGDAVRYIMTDHAIERAEERGVGIMEVYSAIADPDMVRPDSRKRGTLLVRGDIGVVVSTDDNAIITVIDMYAEGRDVPREPINPLINRRPEVATRTKATTAATLDEAWLLMKHKVDEYRKVTITPTFAKRLLDERNSANRPVRTQDVNYWAGQIESGEFARTHQGMAMDRNGVLQDGQNRLLGCVLADKPIEVWFLVGADPANFDRLDSGRNRSFGDVLALSGETQVYTLGAAVRLVHLYNTRDFVEFSRHKVTNHMVMETFNADDEAYRAAVREGCRLTSAAGFKQLNRTACVAALYLIGSQNKPEAVEEFFDGLVYGTGIDNRSDPRAVLRRQFINAAEKGHRTAAATHLAQVIKAWNAWVEDRQLSTITFKKGEPMPRVTRFEG